MKKGKECIQALKHRLGDQSFPADLMQSNFVILPWTYNFFFREVQSEHYKNND